MNDNQSTSALCRAARTLAVVLLAACAACTSLTPTQRPTGDVTALEQRARTAAESGNSAAAADLYTQLAAAASGTTRIGYLLEAARLAADYGDTALARRRIGEARNGATASQQQASAVLLARLELADGRPQAALDMLAALPQPLALPAQSDAAAVRGQALFRLGRPVEAVRVLVEREIWLGDAAAILANQRADLGRFSSIPHGGSRRADGRRRHRRLARARAARDERGHGPASVAADLAADLHDASRGSRPARRAAGRATLDRVPGADRGAVTAVVAATPVRARHPRRLHGRASAQLEQRARPTSASTTPTRLGSEASVLARATRRRRLHRGPAADARGRSSHRSGRLRPDAGAELRDQRLDCSSAAFINSRWRPTTKLGPSRRPRSRPARRTPSCSPRATRAAIESRTTS